MFKAGTIWLIATLTGIAFIVLIAVLMTEPAQSTPARVAEAKALLKTVRATETVDTTGESFRPLPDVADPKARKALFIAAMLPIIVSENERIADQRRRAQDLDPGSAAYAGLAHSYGLAANAPRATLLRRIDIVPAALVLAQGAIESAWGTSRFAREGNAFFGMRSYDDDAEGMEPRQAKGFVVQSYPTPRKSVRRFLKTLNTHDAYATFRKKRAELRDAGTRPTGLALAQHLKPYSEIGQKYVKRIKLIINANGLSRYEGLHVAEN